jgi:hypothetical protein
VALDRGWHELHDISETFYPRGRLVSTSTLLAANVQTAAGIISLLNDYLLSTGRPSFGWLNPWLYSYGLTGLNDIMLGSNPGCESGLQYSTAGFLAIPGWGWDPSVITELVSF